MKTYVLMIGKSFMKGHPKAGQPTDFKEKLLLAQSGKTQVTVSTSVSVAGGFHTGYEIEQELPKIHTIRGNPEYWARIVEEVNSGKAQLSLREWTGKPYNSKQEEFLRFGVNQLGIQKASITWGGSEPWVSIDGRTQNLTTVAHNDGLTEREFMDWFQKDFEGCILHFSSLRY